MTSKEELEKFFSKCEGEVDVYKILKQFDISREELDSFLDICVELEKEGKIFLTKNNTYLPLVSDFGLKIGTLKKSKKYHYYIDLGNGKHMNIAQIDSSIRVGDYVFALESMSISKCFKHQEGRIVRKIGKPDVSQSFSHKRAVVECENSSNRFFVSIGTEKIYLKKSACNSAYPGDIVTVLVNDYDRKIEAVVENVIERKQKEHIFECREKNQTKQWVPIGTEDFNIVQVPDESVEIGTRVLARIEEKSGTSYCIKILNEVKKNSILELEIETILLEHGFRSMFPSEVSFESELIQQRKRKRDEHRIDLRALDTFTIDSSTAKDLDDAISLEKKGTYYQLYVHIADVSHYIKPEDATYYEALTRGTSVYMANQVTPMLPPLLSNDICSLNPNEDKLTKTCMMKISEKGELVDFAIYKSIIRSNYKMCYEKVNDVLTGKEIDLDYLPYYSTLVDMYQLAEILQKKRFMRGSFCFQTDEMVFQLDECDMPLSFENRVLGPSAMIIENFMLLANTTVATYATSLKLPFVYRNHDLPTFSQNKRVQSILKEIDPNIRGNISISSMKILCNTLSTVFDGRGDDEQKKICEKVLKSLGSAYYSEKVSGHYGLALDCYATFTSPIRRAPDLLNHTFLDQVVSQEESSERLRELKNNLPDICAYLSNQQKEADSAQKQFDFYMLQLFASSYLDMPLCARVQYMDEEGMYVKTENKITGFISSHQQFYYQQKYHTFYDVVDKNIYHIGDPICVQIKSLNSNRYVLPFEVCSRQKQKMKALDKK